MDNNSIWESSKRGMMNKIKIGVLAALLLISACSKKGPEDVPLPVIPPTDSSSTSDGDSTNINKIPPLDNAVVQFMNKYDVPGLSLAITKNGKLVYTQVYGFADKENEERVTTKSLFRIGSLSKSFTAVTIMHLREEGKLTLDDKVFGQGGILGTDFGTPPYSNNITSITINNLLHHTAGGWGNSHDDPMFNNPDLDVDELVSYVLDHRPLDYPPGIHYEYSNFGYCILGRVIEKLTGKPYDEYVKDSILKPIGITDMEIGRNLRAERWPNEVVYYGQGSKPDPYRWDITRLDSDGGWIATPTDLVRFLVHIDGFPSPPDMLDAEGMTLLTTTSSANPSYACGLNISSNHNWWHTGALAGTATVMIRTPKGMCWAMTLNTRSTSDTFWSDLVDGFIWQFTNDSNMQWPNVNLF